MAYGRDVAALASPAGSTAAHFPAPARDQPVGPRQWNRAEIEAWAEARWWGRYPWRTRPEPPQHPGEHRPHERTLLAVDQQLGERPGLRVGIELADPPRTVEVGKRQDVEQLGTGSRT